MDVPALSSEERAEAWAKAAAIRKARSNLLAAVQAGELTVSDVLEQAETSAIVSKTRVSVVMKALPGAHAMWATRILEQLSIADAQRIGGLSAKQRHALRGSPPAVSRSTSSGMIGLRRALRSTARPSGRQFRNF